MTAAGLVLGVALVAQLYWYRRISRVARLRRDAVAA
jgi:hypothetical protein